MRASGGWLAVAWVVAACGADAGPRDVVEPRQLSGGSGEPRIERVIDLGDMGLIPSEGAISIEDSDGEFVVGELFLIEGDGFGKLPTIRVGERSAESLARTGNGGIVCRIPPGVPTGTARVAVSHPKGSHAVEIEILRYALVVEPGAGRVHAVSVDPSGAAEAREVISVPGARDVAYSADGQNAYVVADAAGEAERAGLEVIALTAGGGPRLVRRHQLPGRRGHLVVTARDELLGAAFGEHGMSLLDLGVPRTPAIKSPVDLAGEAIAAALDPEGKRVAFLLGGENALQSFDVSELSAPRPADPLPLLEAERVPRLRDLGFSPDGGQVWIVAGDNEASEVGGTRPASLLVADASGAAPALERSVELSGVGAPRALGVARQPALGGGTAIRSRRQQAALVVARAHRKLLRPAEDFEPSEVGELGQLVRSDLDGRSRVLAAGEWVFTDTEIDHDLKWVVSAAARVERSESGEEAEFGLARIPLEGGELRFLRLGGADAEALLAPGAVALAP